MSNPILLGKTETLSFDLYMVKQELEKHLRKIQDILPETYTSITLICRTNKEKQEIILSNKYDVDADINALKTCIKADDAVTDLQPLDSDTKTKVNDKAQQGPEGQSKEL